MNKKALSLAICFAMAMPTVSSALSLGEIQSNSSLNQPFRGKINLLSTNVAEAKTLRIKVASQSVFDRVGIDRPAFLNSIRFNTTIENGRPVINVSSSQPIHEPFLNFLLEVSWPNGQLLKEYTVLLDPPVLMRPNTAIASNTVGTRAEPRAQGRINRPVVQPRQRPRRVVQQPRRVVRAAQPRRAPVKRVAPVRRVVKAAPRVSGSYRVKRGDTLTKIANRVGYSGIRSEQMIVALFKKNRKAFTNNNMNNLKAGVVLKRPSLREVRALTSRKARSEIIAQAREWKKARATLLAKRNGKKGAEVASNQNSTRPIPASMRTQQARLEVVGSKGSVANNIQMASGSSSNKVSDLRRQIAQTAESLTSKKKENEELKSRVTELESLLRKKNRLITLKSEQLATLEKQIAATGGVPIKAPADVVINNTPAVNDGEGIQQTVASNTAKKNGEIIRTENNQPAIVSTSQQEKPPITDVVDSQPETTSTSAFKEDPVDESFDIMALLGSPLAAGIGVGSLAIFGGLLFMRRRKNKQDEEYSDFDHTINIDDAEEISPIIDDFQQDADMNIDSADEINAQVNESDFIEHDGVRQEHMKSTGLLDDEEEDLLQEADVYIVYGLHDQAETELKKAIDREPNNLAYHAKLLENYKAAGNKEAFEEGVNTFLKLDAEGKEKFTDDITEWGSEVSPGNKLFSGNSLKKAALGAGVAMVAGTALADGLGNKEESLDDLLDSGALAEGGDFDSDLLDDDLDSFDFDDILADSDDDGLLDDIDIDAIDRDDLVTLDSSDKGDDFDASLDKLLDEDFSEDIATTDNDEFTFDDADDDTPVIFENNQSDVDDGLGDLEEIDFGVSDKLESANALNFEEVNQAEDTVAPSLDDGLDLTSLNLDLDSDGFDMIMPDDNQYKNKNKQSLVSEDKAPVTDRIDGVMDNEIEDNLLAEFDDNLSFLDLDSDDTSVIEETQIDTKLDLAKAYIDMGDIEGARSTLEEVMQEGSDNQKREAEELLHQTG